MGVIIVLKEELSVGVREGSWGSDKLKADRLLIKWIVSQSPEMLGDRKKAADGPGLCLTWELSPVPWGSGVARSSLCLGCRGREQVLTLPQAGMHQGTLPECRARGPIARQEQ